MYAQHLYATICTNHFRSTRRQHFITEDIREELQKYIGGTIAGNKQKLYAIYCMPHHTHVCISCQPSIAISDITRDIKAKSSGWLKEKHPSLKTFSWQEGFGAFSYSKSQAKKRGRLHFKPADTPQKENV